MPRSNLPGLQSDADGTSFFPSFQREMNRLFDQFRSGFPMPEIAEATTFGAPLFPAMDIVETEGALKISAEVPGVKEDDLDVSIAGDLLVIKGEKSAEHEETEDNFHTIERRYGSFRRQIKLGFSPDEEGVNVRFKDGVLKLDIAKPAAAKAEVRKIKISNG
ncbi:Hsp20/alpha crystallin family protein [Sulfitobacter sp. JB4-11]|uniref:Hsp20/alpha crystallin family protein n=1 Tax=Sulfitobacter rhodophyticola TaxID=3238304 RepID=UPI003512A778